MSAPQEFSVGEYVKRRMDEKVGRVKSVNVYNGDWLYSVQFDPRDTEDVWSGTTGAWKRATDVHAHVSTESRDCDGRYTGGHVVEMTLEERCSAFGELEFKGRVLTNVVTLHGAGTLQVTPDGLEWWEQTDEGYSAADVRWCEDECPDERPWMRDHTAEAAGY